MENALPIVVLITIHPAFASVYERHLGRYAKVVVLPTIEEFLRRALVMRARMIIVDFHTESITQHSVELLHTLHTQPVTKAITMLALCARATPQDISTLHDAGISDIILTAHHAPRAIAERIHHHLSL